MHVLALACMFLQGPTENHSWGEDRLPWEVASGSKIAVYSRSSRRRERHANRFAHPGCHASRAVNEEGYQVAREPDGTFHFRRPDGSTLQDVPEPATVTGDPVRTLQAANEVRRPRIHARTGCPGWLGERLDVGWAIDVLHPRAAPISDHSPDRPA